MSLSTGNTTDLFEENNSAMYPNRGYRCCQLGIAIALAVSGAIASSSDRVIAQIVPDSTLGAESSVVTPQALGSSAAGNAGNIDIRTGSLSVTNGAQVAATNEATFGAAGNIEVAASSIRLDNQALLSSDTISGQGNIILSEDLVLRRGSNIRTSAQGTATGGNSTINAGVILALEDSDITATGTATFNTLDVDSIQGLVTLPAELVDASSLTGQGCAAIGESEFIITGRSGLPPSPTEPLNAETVLTHWATLEPEVENRSGAAPAPNPIRISTPTQIVEANGWEINNKGEIILTANAPITPHIPASCSGS